MAVFDIKIWRDKRPSDLKGLGVNEAITLFNKTLPDNPKVQVPREEAYNTAVKAVETAFSNAHKKIKEKREAIEKDYAKKMRNVDAKKKTELEQERDAKDLEYQKAYNAITRYESILKDYKRDYLVGKSKQEGTYDKNLKEILNAYKDCCDSMEFQLGEMQKLTKVIEGMVKNWETVTEEEKESLRIQYRRALPKVVQKLKTINEEQTAINHQNKEAHDPLRMKIVEYNISKEDVTGPLAAIYRKQSEASNKILSAYRSNNVALQTLTKDLG
jgi:hypothetical protein